MNKIETPIGVFGGTFDPIHCGHLAIAEHLSAQGILPKIHFVPCLIPPHRKPPQAKPEQRLAMIRLAIAGHPEWVADDIDFQRPGPSFMIDTLALLRQRQPTTPWCLILGMDAFTHFNQWQDWQKILVMAHILIVNRPGYSLPEAEWCQSLLASAQATSAEAFKQSLSGKIFITAMPPSAISGTEVRHRLSLEQPKEKEAVPPAVLKYIEQYRLYK